MGGGEGGGAGGGGGVGSGGGGKRVASQRWNVKTLVPGGSTGGILSSGVTIRKWSPGPKLTAPPISMLPPASRAFAELPVGLGRQPIAEPQP